MIETTSTSNTKGHLLIIGERFYPEEFLINDVVSTLQSEGFEITVITQNPSYPFGKVFEGYRNKFISKDTYWGATIFRTLVVQGYNKSVLKKIFNYLAFIIIGIWVVLTKLKKIDKVLIYQTGPLSQAIIGIIAKRRFKTPLYIWTWDIWPDTIYAYGFKKLPILSWFLDKFVTWVYKCCDHILISSPGFEQVLSKYAPNKPFQLLPNWNIDSSINLDNTIIEMPNGFNYTFTGNIGKVQNLDNVIKGFALALKQCDNIYLHIVGDGSAMEDLKKIVDNEKISNVKFWGRYQSASMPSFYESSQALIISLKSESVWGLYIPSKFQTYLQAKKPILAVIGGTVKGLVDKYELGISVPPDNISLIAKAFLDLKDKSTAQKQIISQNAQYLLLEYFDRKSNLLKLTKLLSSN